MKLLTVTNMWPTADAPQFGVFVSRQVDELRRAGIDVSVLFIDGRSTRVNYARGIFAFRAALGSEGFDVIQANYVFSGVIARAQRQCPIVLTHHGVEVFQTWQAPLCWAMSRLVDRVVVRSEQMRQRLGLPSARVIPAGVDLDLFRPRPKAE